MSQLKNPVTGHQINTDDSSIEFWKAAGYRSDEKPQPAKKASAKKSSK